jgi:hypothetical protein
MYYMNALMLFFRFLTSDIFCLNISKCSYFGGNPGELPHPDVDWDMFVKSVKPICDKEPKVWNPVSGHLDHMINFKALKKTYHKGGGCTIM